MRVLIIAFIMVAIAGCSQQKPESVRALKVSLIGLNAATTEGVTLNKFSDLVLDARTKFEIAKNDLPTDETATVENAVVAAEEAKSVWSALENPDPIPDGLYDQLKDLGIEKSKSEFTILVGMDAAAEIEGGAEGRANSRKKIISAALTSCSVEVGAALKELAD